MKRSLSPMHRWVGIALALFMLMWLSSGLAIRYAGPSSLGAAQQLENRELLRPDASWLSLGEALARSQPQKDAAGQRIKVTAGRLVRQAGHPLWLAEDRRGERFALSAIDGRLHPASPAEAEQIAARWVARGDDFDELPTDDNAPIAYLDTRAQDSSVRKQEALRPFHRVMVGAHGRELLISERTGEVVRDSTPLTRSMHAWLAFFNGFTDSSPVHAFASNSSAEKESARSGANAATQAMLAWHPAPLEFDADQEQVVELSWRGLGDEAVLVGLTRSGERLPQTFSRPTQAASSAMSRLAR